MTRFLHVTDLHVSAPQTNDATRQTDTVAALDRLIEVALRLDPRPDFIVASGDLTNVGDEASYRLLAERFEGFDIPVHMTLGNHDRRAGWHSVFPGHHAAPDGPVDHDAVLGGVHVVALDSSVPGRVSGALDDEQIERAAEMLGRNPDLPKLVAIHHPPRLDPSRNFAWATLDQHSTDRLASLLEGRSVLAVLSGHVHMNRVAMWHGVPLVVTMGQQSTVDLTRTDALAVVEGTGFAICDLLPSGLQTTFVPLAEPRLIKEISVDRLRAFS
ncbi:metallophosphoesterase family protein [Lutimaribacter marinistellae]|uniref:Metallophosphoesterase family protein n=1 Tax=Lutimaribacter marinistellae TaxID=1820329 RepID=A0ABV7TKE8_9RHOB